MEKTSYNLLNEKWIKVRTLSNEYQKCSIIDIIQNAHLYKEFDIEEYNHVKFLPYEYLLIRFFATLIGTVLHINDNNIKSILANKQFDVVPFQRYFEQWSNRFDLFDEEYPFMQTFKADLDNYCKNNTIKIDNEALLSANPTSPAASGRLYYTNIQAEDFKANKQNVTDDVYVLTDNDKARVIHDAVIKSLPISVEQYAYIVLYNNSLVPGVGSGNKSAIAGNSGYWEILEGNSLFETLVLNTPVTSSKIRGNAKFNKPIWEWNSTFDIFHSNEFGTLAGMFVPARLIHGEAENGIITQLIYSNLKGKDDKNDSLAYNKWLDDVRPYWALQQEPHAIHKNAEMLKKDTNNPYCTLNIGSDTWLILIGEAQRDNSISLAQQRLKMFGIKQTSINSYANNISNIPTEIMNDEYRLVIYYRICDGSKWTYQKTGKLYGHIPKAFFEDNEFAQQYILQMAEYIQYASSTLKQCVNEYTDKSTAVQDINISFINQLSGFFGIYEDNGYLQNIVHCSDESDLNNIYTDGVKYIISIALQTFDSVYSPSRTFNFWEIKKKLSNFLYKAGGLNIGNKK